MQKLKIVLIAVLAALVLIVVLQNTTPVETRFLSLSVTMPRAVLLLITGLVGFALGVLVSLVFLRKGANAGKNHSR
jgi:uncharacterized integral membrane protein